MDSFLLQKQIKDNASNLQDFCKDLKEWGEQMKLEERKANPAKFQEENNSKPKTKKKPNKTKDVKEIKEPTNSHKVTDYSAWDKFDVEAECARLDKNSSEESDISDEVDEANMDLAMQEKEKGNKFVKDKKWQDAINCYTNAIDSYAYDPIFYANRALCYLKLENYKKAEADCTIALKLDKTYVKAYQRRAAAREKLNLLVEAKSDLLKVLDIEPKNNESKKAFENIEKLLESIQKPAETQRPVSKFTLSRQKRDKIEPLETIQPPNDEVPIKNHVKENVEPRVQTVIQAKIDMQKKTPIWPSVSNIEMIKPIYKLPNLRSKKPLKRIDIKEVEDVPDFDTQTIKIELEHSHEGNERTKSTKGTEIQLNNTVIYTDKTCEKIEQKRGIDSRKQCINTNAEFIYPKTAVQFYNCWKVFGNSLDLKYNYLKQINGKDIGVIFKDSLDTKVFSEVIETLAHAFIKNSQPVYPYLNGLTQVKRFSTLTMFMTSNDKKNFIKLLEYLKNTSEVTNDKINSLMDCYELKC